MRRAPKTPEEAGFSAGAALAALHPIAYQDHPIGGLWRQHLALAARHRITCHDHPIGGFWRQRLALANTAARARHAGRTEDEAALRDAWYLRRAGDDPGPAGRLLQAWRRLAERDPLDQAGRGRRRTGCSISPTRSTFVSMPPSRTSATPPKRWPPGRGVRSRRPPRWRRQPAKAPRCRGLALWLADAVLAHRLKWPAPIAQDVVSPR